MDPRRQRRRALTGVNSSVAGGAVECALMTDASNVLQYAAVGEISMRRLRWIVVMQLIQLVVVVGLTVALVQEWSGVWVGLAEWGGVSALQWLLLLPIVEPRIDREFRKPWGYWLAACVVGWCVGVIIAWGVGMGGVLLWFFDWLPW